MYQVFNQVWDRVRSKPMLQFVAQYPSIEAATMLARKLKGIVTINGHICIDLR